MCIMYNPPRIFNMLWKILRYLIDARVHAKARCALRPARRTAEEPPSCRAALGDGSLRSTGSSCVTPGCQPVRRRVLP